MDILNSLKIDITLFLAIIGLTEFIKGVLTPQLKKIFWLIPILITALCIYVMFMDNFNLKNYLYNFLIYLGTSVMLYEFVVKGIKNKIEQMKKTD